MDGFVSSLMDKAHKHPSVQQEFTFWENVQGFYHAVDWTEPWLLALLATHVVLFVLVVRLRNHHNFQLLSFIALSVVVFFAENLNTAAGRHWRSFSTQNYFDSGGLFTSTVFSAPLLVIVFTQLLLALKRSMELVVQVKRLELQHNKRAKAGGAGSGNIDGGGDGDADGSATGDGSGGGDDAATNEGGDAGSAGVQGVRRRGRGTAAPTAQ